MFPKQIVVFSFIIYLASLRESSTTTILSAVDNDSEKINNPCTSKPCLNEGICSFDGNNFNCECKSPYSGDKCEQDPCTSKPCLNEGICSFEGNNINCQCKSPYSGDKCEQAIDFCNTSGGHDICIAKGKNWKCVNDLNKEEKYKCECEENFHKVHDECIAIDFCNTHGGNDVCIAKGKNWRCVNDLDKREKYYCECEENFQEVQDNCIAIDFCKTRGGHDICIAKGKNWKCVNDLDKEEKYKCECEEFFQEVQNKCIDMKCDCGLNSNSCQRDDQGRKKCHCFSGYAQKAGKCSETCKSSLECKNKGTCLPEKNGYFCKCKPNYKGDKCEINEVCLSMSETCQAIGAVCHYIEWLKKGFCICPPNRTFKKNTNFCEVNNVTEKTEKLESTSIIVIVLCSVAIFLALSAIVLISVFRRYKKK